MTMNMSTMRKDDERKDKRLPQNAIAAAHTGPNFFSVPFRALCARAFHLEIEMSVDALKIQIMSLPCLVIIHTHVFYLYDPDELRAGTPFSNDHE